jgi:NTP pyrophosphatase (non-canonical NTP hydrolase)
MSEQDPPSPPITHPELVTALVKPGAAIVEQLTPEMANLWHMSTGVSGEAGELLDAIKRFSVYNKPLDRINVIEELGDLEFYLEGIRQQLGLTRQEILDYNIAKLSARYSSLTYSDQAAQERADKCPATTDGVHQPDAINQHQTICRACHKEL